MSSFWRISVYLTQSIIHIYDYLSNCLVLKLNTSYINNIYVIVVYKAKEIIGSALKYHHLPSPKNKSQDLPVVCLSSFMKNSYTAV